MEFWIGAHMVLPILGSLFMLDSREDVQTVCFLTPSGAWDLAQNGHAPMYAFIPWWKYKARTSLLISMLPSTFMNYQM